MRKFEGYGQSIIVVVALLATLFVFAATTIDVSYAYAMRRQMQNAADAGALAGAQELCYGCLTCQDAWTRAVDFAQRNGAHDVEVKVMGKVVRVTARVTFHTFFAGIFGIHEIAMEASAAAACKDKEVKLVE